jgi:hypothetical protein
MPLRRSVRLNPSGAATVLLSVLLVAWGSAPAGAQSVVLNPVADTFISEQYPNSNFGAMGYVNVGATENFTTHRALYKFDIAGAIPAGSIITSARLLLEVTRIPNNGYDVSDVGLHRMLRDWGEGDNNADKPSNAAPADPNESNWGYRFAGTSSTWGVPGGQAGVDYLAGASVLQQILAVDGYEFGPTATLTQDLQFWLDNPGANFGWMAISQQEDSQFTARRFGSREALPTYNVPRLLVDFIGVPEPSSAALVLGGSLGLYALRRTRRGQELSTR